MSDDVGDQIATELATQLVDLLTLPAEARFRTPEEVTKEAGMVVSTYCGGDAETSFDRGGNQIEYTIGVAVQQKLAERELADQTDEMKGMFATCTAIKALFRKGGALRDVRLAGCAWTGTEHSPRWSDDHLERLKQFTSLILITFRGWS